LIVRSYVIYDHFNYASVDEGAEARFAGNDAVHVKCGVEDTYSQTSCVRDTVFLCVLSWTHLETLTADEANSLSWADILTMRDATRRAIVAGGDDRLVTNKDGPDLAGQTRRFGRDGYTDGVEVSVPIPVWHGLGIIVHHITPRSLIRASRRKV
jgi:hypothetical protein